MIVKHSVPPEFSSLTNLAAVGDALSLLYDWSTSYS